jgi:hypothetical protein
MPMVSSTAASERLRAITCTRRDDPSALELVERARASSKPRSPRIVIHDYPWRLGLAPEDHRPPPNARLPSSFTSTARNSGKLARPNGLSIGRVSNLVGLGKF